MEKNCYFTHIATCSSFLMFKQQFAVHLLCLFPNKEGSVHGEIGSLQRGENRSNRLVVMVHLQASDRETLRTQKRTPLLFLLGPRMLVVRIVLLILGRGVGCKLGAYSKLGPQRIQFLQIA